MTSRRVMLAGRAFVINLNNRGGVRKAPYRSPRASCMREVANGKQFTIDMLKDAKCVGKGKFGGKTAKKGKK